MFKFIRFGPRKWRYRVKKDDRALAFEIIIEAHSAAEAADKASEIGFRYRMLLVGPQ